jgi:hypothetical protein
LALAAALGWNVVRGLEPRAGRSWARTLCLALAIVFWCPAMVGPLFVALLGGWLLASLTAGGKSLGFIGVVALGMAWLVAWPYRLTCSVPGGAGGTGVRLGPPRMPKRSRSASVRCGSRVLPAALLAWQQSAGSRFAAARCSHRPRSR